MYKAFLPILQRGTQLFFGNTGPVIQSYQNGREQLSNLGGGSTPHPPLTQVLRLA